MASDLRVIVSTLNIASELERIGDHAEGIAKIAATLSSDPPIKVPEEISDMADGAQSMLRASMDAFIGRDEAAARQIVKDDDKVDTLYDKVFRQLVKIVADNPAAFDRVTRLVWVAHNLERSADRVTNICERILYIITGKMEEIGASNY
jgi:phosphate transport system protein